MRFWPFKRRERRTEYAPGYAAQIIAAHDRAAGGGASGAAVLASILTQFENAAAVAESGEPLLDRDVMALAFRELARTGETAFALTPAGLIPAGRPVNVRGGPDPDGWRYSLLLNGPTATESIELPSSAVLHFRRGCRPDAPWRGRSPLADAGIAPRTAAELEARFADATKIPPTALMSLGPIDAELLGDIVDNIAGNPLVAVGMEPKIEHLGPRFDDSAVKVSSALDKKLCAAYGVSPLLAGLESGDGAARREAFRQFLHIAVRPLAAIVEAEASAKLGREVNIDLSGVFAADIMGRARAFRSLTDAGMSPSNAARICGLAVDE